MQLLLKDIRCSSSTQHYYSQADFRLMLIYICRGAGVYSRLRLGGVVPQGNTLALDFVETLLTEVVPVSKKPIFW